MSEQQSPPFTFTNYEVCNYCTHLVRAEHRDGYNRGCELIQNSDGQYARLTFMGDEIIRLKELGVDVMNSFKGCERFCANGLPAHPEVKKHLVKANPKAETTPEDLNATEISWDFESKIDKYPHKDIDAVVVNDNKIYLTIQ